MDVELVLINFIEKVNNKDNANKTAANSVLPIRTMKFPAPET